MIAHTLPMEAFLALRAAWYRGRSHECPCCGTSARAFVAGGGSWRRRERGYCPRCNAKARHRRIWLHLERHTDLGRVPLKFLHVAPHYSMGRRISKTAGVEYTAIDLEPLPFVTQVADVTDLPFDADRFDAVLCVHVLEHVEDDKRAISELARVLRPGGWALFSFPLDLGAPTYEDPSIVGAKARAAAFGESTHVRIYGNDAVARFEAAGFEVTMDLAASIPEDEAEHYGLLFDENILMCRKVVAAAW